MTSSFSGADVDGLDKVAQDCQLAAQVVDEVKAVLEAIVAASFLFGPFGAAFISYLKTVVIPWLTKISEALQLFAKVLSANSQAQRDASSATTSLPSYQTPSGLPTSSTADYPTLPDTAGSTNHSYLGGLVTVTTNQAGDVTDLTLGAKTSWGADYVHTHLDYSQPGTISGGTEDGQFRLGAENDPLVKVDEVDGRDSVFIGTPHLTNTPAGSVTPVYDGNGNLTSFTAKGSDEVDLNGIPLVRASGEYSAQYHYGADGNLDGIKDTTTGGLVLGPGAPMGPTHSDLPAGVKLSETPSAESTGLNYRPPEANFQLSSWFGSFGYGAAGSGFAHTPELTGGLGGGGEEGLSGGGTGTLGLGANGQFFLGSYHDGADNVSGVALGGDVTGGWKLEGGGAYNGENTGGYLTVGGGPELGGGAGGYLIQRNGIDYLGGFGEVGPVDVSAGLHAPDQPELPLPER